MDSLDKLYFIVMSLRQMGYQGNLSFHGSADDESIADLEATLGVKLPYSYQKFLILFGNLVIGEDKFLGIPDNPSATLFEPHPRDLPSKMLTVCRLDAQTEYVLDFNQMYNDGEAPVVQWSAQSEQTMNGSVISPDLLPALSYEAWSELDFDLSPEPEQAPIVAYNFGEFVLQTVWRSLSSDYAYLTRLLKNYSPEHIVD